MNRNEFLEALPLTHLTLKLTSATLEICTDAIDDIHVMVSGADKDVQTLRIEVKGDQLLVEQPAVALAKAPAASSWLQVTIRLPESWKGCVDARTITGWINARGLAGTDLTLETVSGLISGSVLQFRTAVLRSVTSDIRLNSLVCEKATLSTTSGAISVQGSSLEVCSLASITGSAALNLRSPFVSVTANSVIGDLAIDAPISVCSAAMRSVSGRLSTSGVSIADASDVSVHFTTVSGSLDISGMADAM